MGYFKYDDDDDDNTMKCGLGFFSYQEMIRSTVFNTHFYVIKEECGTLFYKPFSSAP